MVVGEISRVEGNCRIVIVPGDTYVQPPLRGRRPSWTCNQRARYDRTRTSKCSIHHTPRTIPQIRRGRISEPASPFSTVVLTPVFCQLLVSHGPFRSILLPVDSKTKTNHSYETLIRRWPVILTTIIDHLYRVGHELAMQPNDLSPTVAEERIEAGKSIIEKIGKVKYEMGRDKPLLYGTIYPPPPVRD